MDQDVVLARQFVVQGGGGPRGFFGLVDDVPQMTLLDEVGTTRLALVLNEDGPQVTLFDEAGEASLTVAYTSQPIIRLFASERDMAVRLEIDPTFGGSLILTGADGQSAQMQAEHPDYGPTMALFDSNGIARYSAALARDNPGSSRMIDIAGVPMLSLADSEGNPRVLTGVSDDRGAFQTFLAPDRSTIQELPKRGFFG
jgi:hypothetical protein